MDRKELKERIILQLIAEGECDSEFNTKDINELINWIEELEGRISLPEGEFDKLIEGIMDIIDESIKMGKRSSIQVKILKLVTRFYCKIGATQ